MPTPEQRIVILDASARSLLYGWLSLVPVLGAGFAVAAWRQRGRVRTAGGADWNPASRHLYWGGVLARIGALETLGWLAFVGILCAYG